MGTENMAEGTSPGPEVAAAPQAANIEVKPPIPGMSTELFTTLNKRHPLKVIEEQRTKYKTHEEFLADAEKEAEHIRTTLAQQSAVSKEKGLGRSELAQRNKFTEEEVVAHAGLADGPRLQTAENLLGIELTSQQKKAILEAHQVGKGELGKDDTPAGVFNYKVGQLLRKAEILKKAGFTEEQRSILLEAGITGALEKLRAAAKKAGIKKEIEAVTYAEVVNPAFIASDAEINKLVTESRASVEAVLYPQTEVEQKELECVLYFVTDRIGRVYTEAMSAAPKVESDWGVPPKERTPDDRINDVHSVLDNYEERFWNYGDESFKMLFEKAGIPFPGVAALREKYGSLASLVALKAGRAIEKELKGIGPPISKELEEELIRMPTAERRAFFRTLLEYHKLENIGDFYLLDIKAELFATRGARERKRREERKRATANERLHYSDWRERFDFTWAETAEELDDSIDDWLDYFQNALPQEIEDAMYQEVQKGLANALAAYEKARNRIGIDSASILAESQREKIISHVKKISGARLVDSKKGMEYFLKLKQDIAAKYDAYEDATYLREGFAIMADKIAENDGAYYKGGPKNIHKPLPGQTEAYRAKIRREAIEYGATRRLYITKEDFENAELGETAIRREAIRNAMAYNANPANKQKKTALDVEAIVRQKMDEKRDKDERGGRYVWGEDDSIEDLLLRDSRGRAEAGKLLGPYKGLVTENQVTFKAVSDFRERLRTEIAQLNLSPQEATRRLGQEMIARKADINAAMAEAKKRLTDRNTALAKIDLRTGVFKGIKDLLDKEDGLFGKTPEERKDIIRQRIKDKIKELGLMELHDEIEEIADQDQQDKALWEWVEEYNQPKLEKKKESSEAAAWFPSLWDEERLSINRPELLVNRTLEEEQFKAMIEKINDPYEGLTDRQIGIRIRNQFREQIQREVQVKNLSPDKAKEEFDGLMKERERDIKDKIENVLFERKQRMTRAIRNFNINVDDDKFKGLEARWGGLTSRVVNMETGELELTTLYAELEEILKAKIDKDRQDVERDVKEWEEGFLATHPGLSQAEIDAAEVLERKSYKEENLSLNLTDTQIDEHIGAWKIGYKATYNPTDEELEEDRKEQRRLFRRNYTFGAVLGLEEMGIAKDLPIWNYFYYGDESLIGAFAPLVGYTDDDKGDLPELLDRPRREMEAVWYFLGQQHMDGQILEVVDRKPGSVVKDKKGNLKPGHEERWVRLRVINAGGNLKLRGIFEMMFMISTSGGVEVVPLAAKIGSLGVWDEVLENGQRTKQGWQGFRKRRCLWEYRQQSFFNTREWADPLAHVERLAGAVEARKYLVGGEIQGQGHIPGALIEPMSGAYKFRDELFDWQKWIDPEIRKKVAGEQGLPGGIADKATPEGQNILTKNIQDLLETSGMSEYILPTAKDRLVEIGAGIMKPLIDYMNARRYLMNRAGLAPKNWKYDNELIVNAYFNELFNEDLMGSENLAYAPQGRSRVAIEIFKDILKTSTYHILVEKDHKLLYPKAVETKIEMDRRRRDSVLAVLPQEAQQGVVEKMGLKREELEKLKTEKISKEKKELEKLKTKPDKIEEKIRELEAQLNMEAEEAISALVDERLNEKLHEQLQTPDPVNNPIELNLPPDILKMLNARWKFLRDQHTQGKTTKKNGYKRVKEGTDNIEAELKRVLDYYIEKELRKNFSGEWFARLVA